MAVYITNGWDFEVIGQETDEQKQYYEGNWVLMARQAVIHARCRAYDLVNRYHLLNAKTKTMTGKANIRNIESDQAEVFISGYPLSRKKFDWEIIYRAIESGDVLDLD